MNKSLKNKLTNLILISRKDPCICTYQNQTHLYLPNFLSPIDFNDFFSNKNNVITIKNNWDEDKYFQELLNTKSFIDFINLVTKYQIFIPFNKLIYLEIRFEDKNFKHQIISEVFGNLKNLNTKLLSIYRKAKSIQRDKGHWPLFITKHFLVGDTPYKKQIVNAPLILFPIEIAVNKNTITIKKINANNLNEKLIVYLQRDIDKQIKPISAYYAFNDLISLHKEISTILETHIKLNNETNPIVDEALQINDLTTIGIYDPSGGALYENLTQIIKNNEIDSIFHNPITTSFEDIKTSEWNDQPIYQINNLDLYQRYAIISGLKDNTIIYGPPGTGKSEVIINLLVNIFLLGKNALVCSEKAAALTVIEKRLKDLSIFMLSLFDLKEKNLFYDSIIKLTNYLFDNNYKFKNNPKNAQDYELIENQFNTISNFKKSVTKLLDFKKYKNSGIDFLNFCALLNQYNGSDFLTKIINSNLIGIYQKLINLFGIPIETFFEKMNIFISFCKEYKLTSKQEYNNFLKKAMDFKKISETYSDLNNPTIINNTKKDATLLANYLIKDKKISSELYTNYFKVYDDVSFFKEFKNKYYGLINQNFFEDYKKSFYLLKSFINNIQICKKSHQKYLFDNFVKKLKLIEKKPFKKIFYKFWINKKDKKLLEDLKQLNLLNLTIYDDFNYLLKNHYLFNPLTVMYFFDNTILDIKYFTFIKHSFFNFTYDHYLLFIEFEINNKNKWNDINLLIELKNIFNQNFGELINNNLFQNQIELYKQIDCNSIIDSLKSIIKSLILKRINNLNYNTTNLIKEAIRVANLKRRPSIYTYIKKFESALKHLFLVYVSRPDAVATFIPNKANYFEFGIFDEASQMFLERAYPLLYRCQKKIIAGDDKQLRPTNFFTMRNYEDDDYEVEDLDTAESLLDRSKSSMWNEIMLKNHYRSNAKELIAFSSEYFYDNQLNYASINQAFSNNLEIINVKGNFINYKNTQEVEVVLELLEANVDKYKSILVVSFNIVQANYLINVLVNYKNTNKKVYEKYLDQTIEITNLESVQGNEADLVIISVGYGKRSESEKLKATFGPLVWKGGKNRLNVAITRAKEKMIVVKSLNANDIKINDNENLIVFQKFIGYLDMYNKNKNDAKLTINKNNITPYNQSPFFINLLQHIFQIAEINNLKVLTDFYPGNKKLDIAIYNENKNQIILGIIIDPWNDDSHIFNKEKQIDDVIFLQNRNYNILYLQEYEWIYQKDFVLKKINKIINQQK